jgi:transposase
MDLVRIEGDEKIVPHSADDSHQRHAQGDLKRARSTSRRVEVIIGEERRRRWSPEDKATITAESFVPGANISAVARQYGVSQGLLHYWRRCARERISDAQEMRFVPVVQVDDGQPQTAQAAKLTVRVEIDSACVIIEGGVDEQVLRTVFSALRGLA